MRIHNVLYYLNNPSITIVNNSNQLRKVLEIIINIIIVLSLILFFLFIKLSIIREKNNNSFLYLKKEEILEKKRIFNSKYELQKNNYDNNDDKLIKPIRKLTTYLQGNFNKQDFIKRKQMKNIIDKLTKTKYIGKWFTKEEEKKKLMIGDSIEGFTKLKFNRATELSTREEALAILISNYEDKYINHWLHHSSFILSKNLSFIIDKEKKLFYLIGKWETQIEYGELFFTKISRKYPCGSNLLISFPLKNITFLTNISNGESFIETIDTIDNSNFTISFNSTCGFNMSMEIYPEDQKRLEEIQHEVYKYIVILIIIIILNMISEYLLNLDLKKNNEAISSVSFFSLIQNVNWHVYCCITHLAWSLTNNKFFYHFSIIGLLYIFYIIGFDFAFIVNFWKIKKEHLSNRTLINLKVCFYLSFYLSFFFSIFLNSDLMIYYPLIYICGIIMWTPQILHNILYYNKYNYPFFYIIISSVERLYYAFYFRAYDNNFYKIKGNKIYIYIIIIYFIINFIIIILQTLKGPRFFLNKKYQKEDFDFFKNKEELFNYSNDIENIECVICLLPILSSEEISNNNKEKEENSKNTDINSSRNRIEVSINQLTEENKKQNIDINILKRKFDNNKQMNFNKKYKDKCYLIKESFDILFIKGFFKFYRIPKNPLNKKYMRTPCNHFFHSLCLEKWLVRKKECPNCRYDLSDKMY